MTRRTGMVGLWQNLPARQPLTSSDRHGRKPEVNRTRSHAPDGTLRNMLDRMGRISPASVLAILPHVLGWLEEHKQCPPCAGRGVVMVAGGPYLKWAFASVSMARAVTDLPIQIWHLGMNELTPEDMEKFADLDVEFVNAHDYLNHWPMFSFGGWQAKSFAVANCRFKEVLLLDADCWPLADPEGLFDSPEFQEFGCIMWPDLNKCRSNDMIFPSMGLKYDPAFQEMEVGQLVIDKERLWTAVRLTVWMNAHSEAFYQMLYGDKDQWQFALRKMGLPFYVGDIPEWTGWGMIHKLHGFPVFSHAMNAKRSNFSPPPVYSLLLDSYQHLQPA